MKEFNTFYFKSFGFDKEKLIANFVYCFDNEIFFEEKIYFGCDGFSKRQDLDENIINNMLFHIHIALGISYYKLFPTKDLILETGFLEPGQLNFWKKFYINGLGEFLYKNNIFSKNLFNFYSNSEFIYKKIDFKTENKALVPIGGGKDSLLTIELLKKANINFETVVFGKLDEIKQNCINLVGVKNLLIKREISPKLFELNKDGYYNGHVPITGIIACILEISAYIYGYKYIILSNEKSANFGNLVWDNLEINHQYSKSLEFEKDFDFYVKKYITNEIIYFSLLRGLYEINIAKLFSSLGKKYFSVFSSCNNNFKINSSGNKNNQIWCTSCPKCLFVYAILRPYLTKEETLNIFGKELYEDKNLENGFNELLGISKNKPFECVGEAEEVIYSMYISLDKFPKNIPYILEKFSNNTLLLNSLDFEKIEKKLFNLYNEDIIPENIKKNINFN